MYGHVEYVRDLQYKVKTLERQVASFKSGSKYTKMCEEHSAQIRAKDREIKKLNKEVSKAHEHHDVMYGKWKQAFDDVEKEYTAALKKKDRENEKLKEQLIEAERRAYEAEEKVREKQRELYESQTLLEEEKGRNAKLQAQINRDYENSSISSSLTPNHKKIPNSREKSGRKPGGQKEHEGHMRKRMEPTERIFIPPPAKYAESTDYKPTGKIIVKQIIGLRVDVTVDQYETPEYRNVLTGQRVHADFPDGIVNDVSYDGSVKAVSFLLNTNCNVSIGKTKEFLSELTGGKLEISTGMINGLCKAFSHKTEQERKKAFADILLRPVMNTDFTNARVDGGNAHVCICAAEGTAMYFAREHKGHDGIKGTPVEDYQGVLVHDHDKTFYNYGSAHQECLAHVLRYLKDSMQNEPELKWNKMMRELLREMIHSRNSLPSGENMKDTQIKAFEKRYYAILDIAKSEYEYEPPSKYYREGYNLYLRMRKYAKSHLLFLRNRNVPSDNNLSERLLRTCKRKQKQMMTMRSFDSLEYLCDSLSVIQTMRMNGENLYVGATGIFDLH